MSEINAYGLQAGRKLCRAKDCVKRREMHRGHTKRIREVTIIDDKSGFPIRLVEYEWVGEEGRASFGWLDDIRIQQVGYELTQLRCIRVVPPAN